MNELAERERNIYNMATQAVTSFKALGIEAQAPEVEQCEVSILIPAPPNKDTLERLDIDLDGFNKLLKLVNEISGCGGVSPRVTGLDTGSWIVNVDMALQSAGHLVTLIAAIITITKSVGELRKKSKGLADEPDVPEAMIKQLEDLADARVKDGLRKLAEELAAKSTAKDGGRQKELANAISINIHFLAKRLDEGVRIEITPPENLPASVQQNKTPAEIDELQNSLKYLKEQALAVAKMEDNPAPVLLLSDTPTNAPEQPKNARGPSGPSTTT
jgi:hypothetical protein